MLFHLFKYFAGFLLTLTAAMSAASHHVNVLIYHHVAENTPASTTISIEKFEQHLDAITAEGFVVVALSDALSKIKNGVPLPAKAVAITFDDGFDNIYYNAFPLLKERNMPFTLFIATDTIDAQDRGMMSWDQIREMKAYGADIANHTSDHDYLVRYDSLDQDRLNKNWQNILNAQQRLEAELGATPKWLAYPYGEYNSDLRDKLKTEGWIGFGQQSGGIAQFSDFQALPRFPAASVYANWDTLRVKLNSYPLPVNYDKLPDPVISKNPPELDLTMVQDLPRRSELSCYINGDSYEPVWLDDKTVRIQADQALPKGRSRYNCTQPSMKDHFYWFSYQWLNRP